MMKLLAACAVGLSICGAAYGTYCATTVQPSQPHTQVMQEQGCMTK